MYKHFGFYSLFLFMMLSSCASYPPVTTPGTTPGNIAEYLAPTYTPRPIPTPFPKSENGEFILLLRKRNAPYEVVIQRLPSECLLSGEACGLDGNLLGALPQGLSQVPNIYWTNDGSKAFFWDDNTTNVYTLDGNQGTYQVFKEEVLKVKHSFLISPDGNEIVFEIKTGDHETDLVSMNVNSGDITKFNIAVPCSKYVSQWIDNARFTFSCEKFVGQKGYLAGVEVYVFNIKDGTLQPFEINRDRLQAPVLPIFSPNRNFMAFTDANTIAIRSVSSSVESILNIPTESFLWSMDSESLAIYSQDKEIFTVSTDGSDLQKLRSLSEDEHLEDWMWLPDNEHIFLITTIDDDGNRDVGVLSVVNKTFTPLNFSLLNNYNPVSISFRP